MSYQYGYGGQAGNSVTANQVTLSPSPRTAYSGQPVILVHMVLDAGTRFATCAPPTDTATHYDTLATIVADVQVEHTPTGALQVTGTIRPDLPDHLQVALREPGWLGGDWRRIGGRMRLVALIHHSDKSFPRNGRIDL